jgi:hypothetical protein
LGAVGRFYVSTVTSCNEFHGSFRLFVRGAGAAQVRDASFKNAAKNQAAELAFVIDTYVHYFTKQLRWIARRASDGCLEKVAIGAECAVAVRIIWSERALELPT